MRKLIAEWNCILQSLRKLIRSDSEQFCCACAGEARHSLSEMQKRKCDFSGDYEDNHQASRLFWLDVMDIIGNLHLWAYSDHSADHKQQNEI
jgi:hypothetical protein